MTRNLLLYNYPKKKELANFQTQNYHSQRNTNQEEITLY